MIKMGKLAVKFILLTCLLLCIGLNSHASISLIDFNIKNNEASTATAATTLFIHATDGNKMNFSCDNSTYSSWVDYATTHLFNLETGAGCSTGDGVKTVYIKIQDENLNQNTGNDSITLDTTGPTINWTWHDANSSDTNYYLNSDYNIIIRVSGETGQTANASIGSTDFNLFDDGAHNDEAAGDGIYGGSFDINEFRQSSNCMTYVIGKLSDSLGNQSTKNSFNQLCIDVNTPTYAGENPKNYVNDRTPDINVQLLDPNSGIKTSVVQIWVNSVPVESSSVNFTSISNGKRLNYTPDSNLSGTTINVAIRNIDNASNYSDVNWSFTIDENAPNQITDLNVRTITGDNDLNLTWSTPLDIGGSGISNFILYRLSTEINYSNLSTASIRSSTISSTTNQYTDEMNVSNEDATYYYAITAVDKAGNIAIISNNTSATVPDLNAPSGITVGLNYYVNQSQPDINVSGNDVHSVKLSCDDENFSASETPPISSFSLISGNGCTNADGNKTLYIIALDNHDNNYKVQREVFLDRIKPTQPTISSVQNIDANNQLFWSDASDNGSEIGHYRVYFNDDGNVKTTDYYAVAYDNNYSHDVTGVTKYCYKIQAVDRAGNKSILSEEVCQLIDVNTPKISVSFPGALLKAGKKFFSSGKQEIKITANYQLETATATIIYTDGNQEIIEITGPGSTLIGTIDLNAIDGNTKIKIETTDLFEFNKETEEFISIDSTPPAIRTADAWQKTEELIGIIVKLPVDAKRLEIVQCEKGNCNILFNLTGEDLNKGYIEKEWNAMQAGADDVNLAFKAYDDLENMNQKTKFILLMTGIEEKMLAINKIQDSLKASLALLKDYMIETSAEIKEKFSEAETHLTNAKSAIQANNIDKVQAEILAASTLLSEIETSKPQITVSNTQTIDYEADRDILSSKLSEHLSGIALTASKNLWKNLGIKREIQSVEINKSEKHALVIIYITNTGTKTSEAFNLIEKIPKKITENAADLKTNTVINIIEADPVVSFYIPEMQPGETRTLKYRATEPISEEKLNEIESNTPELFSLPVPLPAEFEINASYMQQGTQGPPIPLILVVVAALAYYIYWRVKRI